MGTKRANRLSDMTFDEVSVVTSPANQHSKIVLFKSGDSPDYSPSYIAKRQFSGERRKELASEGKALPDGSFPIANAEDLRNAIKAIGRAGPAGKGPSPAKRAQVAAHIKRRAKALGLTASLEGTWVTKAGACQADHRKLGKNERCPTCGMRSSGRGGKMRKDWKQTIADLFKNASASDVLGGTGNDGDEEPEWASLMADYNEGTIEKEDPDVGKKYEDIDLDELPEDVRAAVEELVSDNKTMAKGMTQLQEENENMAEALDELDFDEEDIEKQDDDDDGDGGDEPDDDELTESDIAKAVKGIEDPTVRKIVEKSMRDAEAARLAVKDAIEKADEERNIRLDKEYIAKAETDYHHLGVKAEEIGPAMRQLHDGAPALYEALEKVLKGADAAVKQSKITKTLGSDGNAADVIGGDAVDKVEALAKELQKGDKGLTREGAIAKVLSDQPELYREYNDLKRQETFARSMPQM